MNIKYYKINPGGNVTALVKERTPMTQRISLAKTILGNDPSIEQVGFIVRPLNSRNDARVEMAGGEFCGNAVRSLAYLCWQENKQNNFVVESSGSQKNITANFSNKIASFIVDGQQFLLKKVKDGGIVSMPGIAYLIIQKKTTKREARKLLEKYNLLGLPAAGVVALMKNGKNWNIRPIVWVRDVGSLIEETACASGSLAAAFYLFKNSEKMEYKLGQPSGTVFEVVINKNNQIKISGPIERVIRREEKILI